MTEASLPQWSDEAVAESFRAEIRARLESHNADYRAREAIELEQVLREHPEQCGQPGFNIRDSCAWEVYQASEIRIDRNSVMIVLPSWYAVGIDFVHLFDHTTVAWGRPTIGAILIDGTVHPTIEITLVATWTDEMNAKWRGEGHDRKQVLVELYEEDVQLLLGVLATHEDKQALRNRLEMALVPLPLTLRSRIHDDVSRHFAACVQCRETDAENIRVAQPAAHRRTIPDEVFAKMCPEGHAIYQSYLRWLAEPDW